MSYSVLTFIVGGCAGWVVSSIYSSYKRKKLINTIIDFINNLVDSLFGDDDEEKSEENKTVLDINDVLETIKDEIDK